MLQILAASWKILKRTVTSFSWRGARKLDWMRLLRLAKFPFSHHELEWIFPVQDAPEKYVTHGDSDWGGVPSPEGAQRVPFEHLGMLPIEYICSSPHMIALSSGEAELHATGRAAAGGLQTVQLQGLS